MYAGFQDNLKPSMEELSYPYTQNLPSLEMEMEMEQQLRFDMENYGNAHLIHHDPDLILSFDHDHDHDHPNWVEPPAPDLLSLFHLPRYIPADDASVLFDPLFHLNLPPQPPLFGYTFIPDAADAQHMDFAKDITHHGDGNGRKTRRGRIAKPYPTERDRRNHLSGKYSVLRSLVPNPTKVDRASIVSDAIGYIKELLTSVGELKVLVEKKRERRERMKKRKREEDGCGDGEVESSNPDAHSYNLRTSCLQRQSEHTEVDVRLIEDEVTIKLVQQNNINCLLLVSKVLDELHLDLHHVAGGNFGDYCSFMFNTKIQEGSSVYASAIANKLVEVMDAQYAGIAPAGGY